ncbi:peptide MFS transporter, partial [Xanthovirga aplysinae]|uniref:peptide MFS transporter n=1 Tax=Xanthovirga aplysinae TaxID=2529853 RepID=UPI001CA3AE5B
RALLVLFLTASVTSGNAGYGWSSEDALGLYGWYTMLVYVASIPGGIFADKLLGQKKAVMLGGLLLCAGHGVLAVNALWAFYTGLGLIIAGVGFLKPNISTMVGGLYKQGDERRDLGFYIFYIGINLGAFAAGLVIGPLGENVNWHYGFGLAGIGMFIGQIFYMWGQKYLKGVGEAPERTAEMAGPSATNEPSMMSKLFKNKLALLVTLILLGKGVYLAVTGYFFNIYSEDHLGYGILLAVMSIFIGFGIVIYSELVGIERDRVKVLLLSFLVVIVFWGAFEQAGGLMNLYAKEKTNRMITLSLLNGIFIGGIGLLALYGIIQLIKKKSTAMYWLFGAVGLGVTFGLLRYLEIKTDPWEVPATVFQSVNSFFIFTLATAVGAIWLKRKMKGSEASSLFKMAIGVVIMGAGFFFMSAAYAQYESIGSSAMYWLLLAYLFHTLGELCLSPVSLSFITKLAPVKYASLMMGIYFAATGFGNKLAGELGSLSQSAGEFEIFTGIAITCIIFGLLIVALLKPLKRLTHGAEDLQKEENVKDGEKEPALA